MTMEPSTITVSLEWGKKLKEAGWKLEWSSHRIYIEPQLDCGERRSVLPVYVGNCNDHYPAPTAEEILRRLPPSVQVEDDSMHLDIMDDRDWIEDTSWDIGYSSRDTERPPLHVRDKESLANACASMYCYLSDNKLL